MSVKNDNIKSIANAFAILDYIFKTKKSGVSELSDVLDLPKTTVFRILKTLEELNVVIQDDLEQYSLGYELYKYRFSDSENQTLINWSASAMRTFAETCGETINLGILVNNEVQIIHSEVGEFYSLQPNLSPTSPLYCSGMGKIFLSTFDETQLVSYFNEAFTKRTINTMISAEAMRPYLKKVIETQLSYDNEEYEYGLTCVATPLFDHEGNVIAALSVSGPTSRLAYKGFETIEALLLETSQKISVAK